MPFEVFRLELVELIDNLLDILEQNKDFIFHLDGQTIILHDYLEIKPEKKERIKKFVTSGNLLIGPWYVLSDQFLTSGEATIRNLLYGIRDAKEFGKVMLVGYCPDQFGQIAQLPQIFQGFNINAAIVGRGIQDGISEHNWFGLNGDQITAISLTHWYNNAQRIPKENAGKYLEKIYETQGKTSYSKHILLMNGCDHLFPQKDLSEIVSTLNNNKKNNNKWEVKHNSLPSAIQNILESKGKENYPICFGELRDDNNKYILAGTLSTRVYLKLENYKLQTKLEKIIEPLATLLSINNKIKYPYNEIKYAWRLLIQNHAHDSICGCSIDDVHKEMEIRFLKVNQVLEKIKENLISAFSSQFSALSSNEYLQLINLTAYERNEIIEAELEFNKEEIKNPILKKDNQIIDCEILESKNTYKMVRSKEDVPCLQAIQKVKILFEANIKPFSICSYEIGEKRNGETAKQQNGEEKNSHVHINKDGTLSISLKDSDFKFENLHYLTIEDDLGDEYNFVPGRDAPQCVSMTFSSVIEENKFRKKILIENRDVACSVSTEITCYCNSNRIDFKTKIKNNLKNKRIRLHFPTGLNTNYLSADTPFGTLQRSRPPLDWTNYATSQPLHNWIDHSNEEVGLAFFGSGLADYELYEDGGGFAITLIRAVDKLSIVKSHSLIKIPEAQCNRELEFKYSIFPHLGNWINAKVPEEELIYRCSVICNQSNSPLNINSLIKVSDDLIVSSLKRSEEEEDIYVLRLFNPSSKILNSYIDLNFTFKEVKLLTLNEEEVNILKTTKGRLEFEIKPYQILTFGIKL